MKHSAIILILAAASIGLAARNNASSNTNNASLTGKIWEGSVKEKFVGGSLNGHYTGGFFTYQYWFDTDSTYRFVYVGASAYLDANLLQYETGKYFINGNQLTIIPVKGNDEEWSVQGGPVKLSAMSDVQINNIKRSWGKRLKTVKRNLEKYTYSFNIEYWEGNHANVLMLQYNGKTTREGNGVKSYYFETPAEKTVTLPLSQ